MTTFKEAVDATDLNDALRACHEASKRLAAILNGRTSTDKLTNLTMNVPVLPSLPSIKDAFTLDVGSRSAKLASIGQDTSRIYVAGCQGLQALSKELKLPLFKIGSTGTNVVSRLAQMNADRYGSGYRVDEKIVVDAGFDHWKLMTMDYSLPKSADSPVSIESRALRVKLPASISRSQFEGRLRKALTPISLAHWLNTEDGQTHLTARGANALRADRYTPYDLGDSVRLSPANELYIFRHRSDMARLCRLIELIVQDTV